MERLTEYNHDGTFLLQCLTCDEPKMAEYCAECDHITSAIDRLAEYEDTGMEPDEINALREFCESTTSTTLRHIYELVQAEREGRLVVASPTAKAKRQPAGRVSEQALQALEQMGANVHSKEGGV